MVITKDVLERVLGKLGKEDREKILRVFQGELTSATMEAIVVDDAVILEKIHALLSFVDIVNDTLVPTETVTQ